MSDPEDQVRAALDAFDDAFRRGDAAAAAARFTADGQVHLQFQPTVSGLDEIESVWRASFETWDTSAWATERLVVDVHGDRAFTLTSYTETLVHRAGLEPSRLVVGRYLAYLRRDPDGAWRIAHMANSHARPIEVLETR